MDDLWARTLTDLRNRFVSPQKPEMPAVNFIVERLPIPGRLPDQFDPSPISATSSFRTA